MTVIAISCIDYLCSSLIVPAIDARLQRRESVWAAHFFQFLFHGSSDMIQLKLQLLDSCLIRNSPLFGRSRLLLCCDFIHMVAVYLQTMFQVLNSCINNSMSPTLVFFLPIVCFVSPVLDSIPIVVGKGLVHFRVMKDAKAIPSFIIGLNLLKKNREH